MKLKKNDNVYILTGKDKGKSGPIEKVFVAEKKLIVKGINLAKKHIKPSKKNPTGGIVDINLKINASNVMLVCPTCGKATKIGYQGDQDKKVRICKKCKQGI